MSNPSELTRQSESSIAQRILDRIKDLPEWAENVEIHWYQGGGRYDTAEVATVEELRRLCKYIVRKK